MSRWMLTLFVSGQTPRTRAAVESVKRIFELHLEGDFELEVVDVVENPCRAEEERILVTPTLIRREPLPEHRLVGDFADFESVQSLFAEPPLGSPRRTTGEPR